jgi:hypothetical protein
MRTVLTLLMVTISSVVFCQNTQDRITFPDTLWAKNDSFYVKATSWEKEWAFSTTKSDTIDLGTDGYKGIKVKVWTDTDTLDIPYVNSPNEQWIFIPIASIKDTTIYRLRFNPQYSIFTKNYIDQNLKNTTFQIPEVYELANIILYLTECSVLTKNHPMDFEYSKRVNEHFSKFSNHPLIKILNSKCLNNHHWTTYYGFRENSICFEFDEDDFLSYSTPYKHAWSDNSEVYGGEFRNLLYLVQDFVEKTDFRTFYKLNTDYYESLERRQVELQPISKMWKWLEKEFPQKYDHYKVIFSPLIEGSHSTQKFYKGNYKDPEFQECIMFVNSSESLDSNVKYDEDLKVGLASGVVFTEIDHNYVNPTSKENIKDIKKLIGQKDKWATKEAQNNYSSEYAIFNEYMTHSLFCLYVEEHYSGIIKDQITKKRIQLMERRGYPKFEKFNSIVLDELRNRKETIYIVYPKLINALKEIE